MRLATAAHRPRSISRREPTSSKPVRRSRCSDMLKQNPLRLLAGALLLVACSSLPASAAPITIGLFSWQYDASNVDFTLGLDIFVPDWPTSLTLDDVFVDFMRSDGSTGQAFFGGYDGGGVGQKVSVGSSSGSIQVPGFGVGLDPLPQDIVTDAEARD